MTVFSVLNSTPLNGTTSTVNPALLYASDTAVSSEDARLVCEHPLFASDTAQSSESASFTVTLALYASDLAQSSESAYLDPGLSVSDTVQSSESAYVTVERNFYSADTAQASEAAFIQVERNLYSADTAQALEHATLVQARVLYASTAAVSSESVTLRVDRRLHTSDTASSSEFARLVQAKQFYASDTSTSSEWFNLFTGEPYETWKPPPITIGGVVIHLPVAIDYNETSEDIGGRELVRFANGDEAAQAYWTRKKVTMTGMGFMPAGLDMVDWSKPQVVDGTKYPPFKALITVNGSDTRHERTRWSVEATEA